MTKEEYSQICAMRTDCYLLHIEQIAPCKHWECKNVNGCWWNGEWCLFKLWNILYIFFQQKILMTKSTVAVWIFCRIMVINRQKFGILFIVILAIISVRCKTIKKIRSEDIINEVNHDPKSTWRVSICIFRWANYGENTVYTNSTRLIPGRWLRRKRIRCRRI